MANSSKRSVLILCGDYMEDYEVMVPFQALQAYGVSVDAVCPGKKSGDICRTAIHQASPHQTYSESRGHNFTLNATFDEIEVSKYDGLVLPGGRAPEYLAMNDSVLDLVKKFSNFGKPIASICHGQLILAAAGSVKGRKCTAYPSVKPVLIAAGAHWVEPETFLACNVDGNIITGVTYDGHPEYIQLFMKALGGTITGSDKRILFLCGASGGVDILCLIFWVFPKHPGTMCFCKNYGQRRRGLEPMTMGDLIMKALTILATHTIWAYSFVIILIMLFFSSCTSNVCADH